MTAPKRCARCGARLPAERPRVYSTFSKHYYCADFTACARRSARKKAHA